jgi:pyruvate/oxaloacetate carboxyltransferase
VDFEQATIKVEKEAQFAELKAAIERAFAQDAVEKFLKRLDSRGVRIRNFDGVLDQQVIEYVEGSLKKRGKTAKGLYQELSVTDQGQMREFYLSKLEQVEAALRHKFRKLFQYY